MMKNDPNMISLEVLMVRVSRDLISQMS